MPFSFDRLIAAHRDPPVASLHPICQGRFGAHTYVSTSCWTAGSDCPRLILHFGVDLDTNQQHDIREKGGEQEDDDSAQTAVGRTSAIDVGA